MNDPESYGRGPERRAGPDLAEIPVTAAGDSRTHGVPLDLEAPASTRSTGESDGPSQPQCCAAPRSAGCNRITHHVPREAENPPRGQWRAMVPRCPAAVAAVGHWQHGPSHGHSDGHGCTHGPGDPGQPQIRVIMMSGMVALHV